MGLRFMDDRTLYRIDNILEHIETIFNDTKNISLKELKESSLLLRASCFSVAQIGETMVQLKDALFEKYPELPWVESKGMRNVIVHDYGHAEIEDVYKTITEDLPKLKSDLLKIKADLLEQRKTEKDN